MHLDYLAATDERQLHFSDIFEKNRIKTQTPKITLTEIRRTEMPEKLTLEILADKLPGIEIHEITTVAEVMTQKVFVQIKTYVKMIKEKIVCFLMNCNSLFRSMTADSGCGFTVCFDSSYADKMIKGSDLRSVQFAFKEKEESLLSREEGSLCLSDTQTKMIRVLKFLREFTHVTAREVADLMEGEYNSRSYLAQVENGLRNPSPEYLSDYARALQKVLKVKKDLTYVVQKCIEDPELLNLMDEYEQKKGDFRVSYKIAGKIIAIDDPPKARKK